MIPAPQPKPFYTQSQATSADATAPAPSAYGQGQPPPTQSRNIFGLISLILGILALIISGLGQIPRLYLGLHPLPNYLAGFLALLGLIAGIVGVAQKNRRRTVAFVGILVSLLAGITAIVLSLTDDFVLIGLVAGVVIFGILSYAVGIVKFNIPGIGLVRSFLTLATAGSFLGLGYLYLYPNINRIQDFLNGEKTVTIVYEVTGDVTDTTINYSPGASRESTTKTTGEKLPFTQTVTQKITGPASAYTISLTVQGATGTTLSCKITVDGQVIAQETDATPGLFLTTCRAPLPQ